MKKHRLSPTEFSALTKSTPPLAGLDHTKKTEKTFRQGDQLPPHHAPKDVLVIVVEGKMEMSLDDEREVFGPGEYVIFPAGRTHALTCLADAWVEIYRLA